MRLRVGRILPWLLLLGSPPAFSALVLNDGAQYAIDQPSEDLDVRNGTQVSVVSGGIVLPNPDGQAVRISGSSSRVEVGGRGIVSGNIFGLAGRIEVKDEAVVNGGIYLGTTASSDPTIVRDGIYVSGSGRVLGGLSSGQIEVSENAVVLGADGMAGARGGGGLSRFTMTGGTVIGGSGAAGVADFGVDPLIVDISNGLVRGGHGASALLCYAGCSGDISGGTFVGGANGGHAFEGDAGAYGAGLLNISGGLFLGGNSDDGTGGDAFSVFYGGQNNQGSTFNITGGRFDAGLGATGDGWLFEFNSFREMNVDISGGEWGYANAGHGFFLDGPGFPSNLPIPTFNIHGIALELINNQIRGTLLDGSYIDVAITFGENWSGQFNVVNHGVPEPSTLMLLSVCLMGLLFHRRKTLFTQRQPSDIRLDTLAV